jgi:predicted ATPase
LFFKSTEDLNYFKNTVSLALGADLPVLIDMVPLLEKLFPENDCAKAQMDVSPAEAEERTLRILQNFFSCVAFDDRPLVLFIDDLQWSSAAESSVLTALISSFRTSGSASSVRNCLLIISYRTNEVQEGILQKLSESLDIVRRRSGSSETHGVVEIQVGPLHLVCPSQFLSYVGRFGEIIV